MKTSDNASTLSALRNSTVTLTHCRCFTPSLSVYTKHKLHGSFRFCLVFTPSTPDHEKGTMSKKALRGPFSSCHLKQSLACNLACQIACLLQNLEFITLYPNGKKLAYLNSQEMQGSILSNLICVWEMDWKRITGNILKCWEKVQATALFLVLFPSLSCQSLDIETYSYMSALATTQIHHFWFM